MERGCVPGGGAASPRGPGDLPPGPCRAEGGGGTGRRRKERGYYAADGRFVEDPKAGEALVMDPAERRKVQWWEKTWQ